MIFYSIQYCGHISCKYGYFSGGEGGGPAYPSLGQGTNYIVWIANMNDVVNVNLRHLTFSSEGLNAAYRA